ncbi:putative serine/threonine-protein kinase [Hypoxylon sp. EC38]|nr:putative serine/threonine-protein kinase [Hypoxylon sp. EC38]
MASLRRLTSAFPISRLAIHCPLPQRRCFIYNGLLNIISSSRFSSTAFKRGVHQSSISQAPPTPDVLPDDVLVDEERIPGYRPEHYYPAHPGDVLDNRYQLNAKLGWGSSSTVWLAHEVQSSDSLEPKRYVAIKICNSNFKEEDMAYELDMNIHLSSANPDHPGSGVLGTAIEGFTVESPRRDTHLVLVFEPLRESLWVFGKRLERRNLAPHVSLGLIKVYLRIILQGLDYMHSQCRVIHTDLKLDNIMVSFEDDSTIDAFLEKQATHPMAGKRVGDRTVYRSYNDFGPVYKGLGGMIPQITDFGSAQHGCGDKPHIHPIQPDEYRAPEVLLGTGWSYSADMWNFGVMIWELLARRSLFSQPRTRPYSAVQHLADMIALIGDIPPSLVERERNMRHWRWSPEAVNPEGRLSSNALEFFGGPFFTDDGKSTLFCSLTRC